jgi:hypothetical protein
LWHFHSVYPCGISNLIVLTYFTSRSISADFIENSFCKKPETSTAVTVYISIVGIVYHLVLSKFYPPQGLARIADHGLHKFTPIATILYFVYTIIHGSITNFYPYPFLALKK